MTILEELAEDFVDGQQEPHEVREAYMAGFREARKRAVEICQGAHDCALAFDVIEYKILAAALGSTIACIGD